MGMIGTTRRIPAQQLLLNGGHQRPNGSSAPHRVLGSREPPESRREPARLQVGNTSADAYVCSVRTTISISIA